MRRLLPIAMILAVIVGGTVALRSREVPAATEPSASERADGSYMSIIDEAGTVLHTTGHMVEAGDEWVTHDNRHFRVTRVEGDIAFARFVGPYDLAAEEETGVGSLWDRVVSLIQGAAPVQAPAAQVAIYHTHSDESYVPSDGTYTVNGRGGVYDVGRAFRDALVQRGVRAVQDLSMHLPHDASAYQRSRRTVADLLKTRPIAMFDVHRDAAPPQAYAHRIDGQNATNVVVVLGRANPKFRSNTAFANALKAEVDRTHPGLVKGFMFRNGGYNQDMYDRLLLLEVGAHTNSKEAAIRSITALSEGVSRMVERAGGAGGREVAAGRGSWSALGWVLGITILGVVVYMFVSTGSFKEAWSKMRRFGREDLAGFLGLPKREKGCEVNPPGEPLAAPEDRHPAKPENNKKADSSQEKKPE